MKCLLFLGLILAILAAVIPQEAESVPEPAPILTHAQMVWSYALEWCESRGNPEEVNPKDLDNTPSYGGYQFKPGTLGYYANLYGVPQATTTMDYDTQRAVIEQMIAHSSEIDWEQQFPGCTRKLGYPPK